MRFEFITICLVVIAAAELAGQAKAAVDNRLETCEDEKCFKNLLKTRPNLLVLFSNSDAQVKDILRVLRETYPDIKDLATLGYINCENAKKLCKKLKVTPDPYKLKHYSDGAFNKDYDRQIAKKSFINFLKDPKGDLPWEEEENAKDVLHLKDEASLNKALKKYKNGILVMFYAPWCGFCKKLKPDYSSAASELKRSQIDRALAAVNVDNTENYALRVTYNITGYPTLLYFKNSALAFKYGGEYTKESLIEWMKNPEPPKEKEPEKSWADEEDVEVTFLTDDTFDSFIAEHNSVLVKFYAPWCGHCKNMKPVFNRVAKTLKEEKSTGIIAFVDATKETKLASRFKVKGFPTVKYFKDGKYAWDYDERAEEKILEFMRNPVEPPPKVEEPSWADEKSYVVHADESNLVSHLKTKKHALVFFYAPWCGHCKNAKPHYTKAAEHFKDDLKVAFVAVDCTKNQAICDQHNVKGFPTIIYFNFGKNSRPYEGGRTEKNFISFMTNPSDPNAGKPSAKDEWLDLPGHEHVHLLDDASFDEFINTKKRVLVMLYAPWCGHCKAMKPAYAQAAQDITSFVPGSYLAAVDATLSPKLAERFTIQGYPTLKYFEQGQFKFDYSGGRTKEDFVNFMRNPVQTKTEL